MTATETSAATQSPQPVETKTAAIDCSNQDPFYVEQQDIQWEAEPALVSASLDRHPHEFAISQHRFAPHR